MHEIRKARREDLPAAAALLAAGLGFLPPDAIPAWFMRTTDECGGITLVALDGDTVVGASYALPAREHELFSCGLAVAAPHRGRRLGLALKLEQRRQAEAGGYTRIRWTADPLNGRALRLYLSGLGARLVAYRGGLHDGLRTDPEDDVDIVWPLSPAPALDGRAERVELPWADPSPTDRRRVRTAMCELLDDGYVGHAVELDRGAGRCWIAFAHAAP